MRKIILPVVAILFVLSIPIASADSFDTLSVTVGEGETKTVDLIATENLTLSVTVLYGFTNMSGSIFITPLTVESGTTTVSVHFAQLGAGEKESIDSDTYRARVDAKDNDGNTEASFYLYLTLEESSGSSVITTLQSAIENLESDLQSEVATLTAAIALAEETADIVEVQEEVTTIQSTVDNHATSIGTNASNAAILNNTQNEYEGRLYDLESNDGRVSRTEFYLTISVITFVCLAFPFFWKWFNKKFDKTPEREIPPEQTAEETKEALRRAKKPGTRNKSKPSVESKSEPPAKKSPKKTLAKGPQTSMEKLLEES